MSRLFGHNEWAAARFDSTTKARGRKSDPLYLMGWRRDRVARLLAGQTPEPPEDDMPLTNDDKKWLVTNIGPRADVVPVGDPNGKNPNWQVASVLSYLVKAIHAQNARIKALASPRDIAAAVVAALPPGVAVTPAQLEAALRSVLGSVDE